jgi:hypothetical protein
MYGSGVDLLLHPKNCSANARMISSHRHPQAKNCSASVTAVFASPLPLHLPQAKNCSALEAQSRALSGCAYRIYLIQHLPRAKNNFASRPWIADWLAIVHNLAS